MSGSSRPLWLERGAERLFAVWHPAAGTATAAVLICPPFLHEAMRSQRLFAMLAEALSRQGCDVLRFDWFGTGDSDGADEAFDLAAATQDAALALAELRRRSPGRPLRVLGVRAGAIPAVALARSAGVDALWLWQPVVDGGEYLEHLRRLDAAERRHPMRYRAPVAQRHAGPGEVVMGYPCSPTCIETLAAARIEADALRGVDLCVLEAADAASAFAAAQRIDLPAALAGWNDQIDMARTPSPPVEAVARALVALRGGRA